MSTREGSAVQPRTDGPAFPLKRWQQLLLLGGLSMFAPLSTDIYLPALPLVGHDLSSSAPAVTPTLTASLWAWVRDSRWPGR